MVLVLLSVLMTTGSQARATHEPALVTTVSTVGAGPRTDGTWVVWSQAQESDIHSGSDIYAANLADGTLFPIATGPASQGSYDIDDGIVIWSELSTWASGCPENYCHVVRMRNLATGEETTLTETSGPEFPPESGHVISASWVVYKQWIGNHISLMARNISTLDQPMTLTVLPDNHEDVLRTIESGHVALDGERLAWTVTTRVGPIPTVTTTMLYTMMIGDDEPVIISSGPIVNAVDVTGDTVVYHELRSERVIAYEVPTGETSIIGATKSPWLTADGRYVFWTSTDISNHSPDGLIGYDLRTDSSFRVRGDGWASHANGDMLAWGLAVIDGVEQIHVSRIADVLPSARRSVPDATDPDRTFTPETGHFLSWGFQDYWEVNGELPVFGYPLTEEFRERNPDTSTTHTVQYFERQRYEYHPENAGTPYDILFGRLGVQILEQQGRDWTDFERAGPGVPHFMPETGHAIAEQFFSYWSSHGLEFDDEGISFRESLALFGYPISEPMMETNADGDTILTQYFERAVFEHHPDNPAAYQVLLRRVGAELLAERGWAQVSGS